MPLLFNILIFLGAGVPASLAAEVGSEAALSSTASQSGAEVRALRHEIGSAASATQVLDRWCVAHRLAPAGAVIAEKIANRPVPPTGQLRRLLQLKASERVQLRHVRLRCNGHILSVARLWYVPSRLPEALEARLQETETPFGKVVAPLHLERRAAGSSSAWPPPPGKKTPGTPPRTLFTQRALLSQADGLPIAYVVEDYRRGLLGFGGRLKPSAALPHEAPDR